MPPPSPSCAWNAKTAFSDPSDVTCPDELDRLVEFMLRIFQSLVIDPGRPPHRGKELRAFLRRWVAPAISVNAPVRNAAQMNKNPAQRAHQTKSSSRTKAAT